eukprot:gene1965-17508_t
MGSNPRKAKKSASSTSLMAFNYQLYEISHVLRLRPFPPASDQADYVKIDNTTPYFSDCCFQETAERSLLVLLCSNGALLMRLKEKGSCHIVKQFEWFQNPSKRVQSFAIDPVHAAWVIVASSDLGLYILPALAQLKPDSCDNNVSLSWSLTDLTKMAETKQTGKTASIVWWHTFDDRNIAIIGTEHGEVVFVDLMVHQQVHSIAIREKIRRLELMQDLSEHATHLLIHTATDTTWKIFLEWPCEIAHITSPSSYTSAFDMGYDMVAECGMDTILVYAAEDGREEPKITKLKAPSQECRLSVQRLKDQVVVARHLTKHETLEVFNYIERVADYAPEYSYQLPFNTKSAVVSDTLIFALTRKDRQRSDSSSYKAELQSFSLSQSEAVLAYFVSSFKRPMAWKNLFPHSKGMKEEIPLTLCTIVTEGGIIECRPRISPEHYFTELCRNDEGGAAEALGITLDLNVQYLCELVAEQKLKEGDFQGATKFYNLSECSPIKRAVSLIEYVSVTAGLMFIRQVLKQPGSLSAKDRKKLADMAVECYTEQVLEKQKPVNFRAKVFESFMQFLRDNFDYDPQVAMERLAKHGMIDCLFEVGKTKGLIKEALDLCASRGFYHLSPSIQNMLLDRGYDDILCTANNGAFISYMKPEEAVKFLLMHPDVTKSFIRLLDSIVFHLEETSLLLIARLFDPSRTFIKPYLEKAEAMHTKRSPSIVSLASTSSSEGGLDSFDIPTISTIFEVFLKTILILNGKRSPLTQLPDRKSILKYLIGQNSSTSLRRSRTTSTRSLDTNMDIEPTTLACGRNHIAYVSHDGDVFTWGRSSHGRLGHGDLIEEKGISMPFRVEGLHMHGIQVLSIACGAAHTVAVCREGVYSWGFNNFGQLGVGDIRRRSRPCLISQLTPKNVVAVAAGYYHTLAVDGDHKVWAWGWGIHGQLGVKSAENAKVPVNVALLNSQKAIQVAAGHSHSVVLSSKGYVFTFGSGLYGQLGIGVNTKMTTPKVVKTLIDEPIYYIACGSFETIAISEDQTLYSWGRNYKQFHICAKAESATSGRHLASSMATDLSHKYYPEELPFRLPEQIAQLSVGNWHFVALTTVGQVYTWGCNDCGQLGHYNKIDQITPRPVKALSRRFITSVAAGSEFTVCVDAEDQVFAWGKADAGQLGIDTTGIKDSGTGAMKKSGASASLLSPTPVPRMPSVTERSNSVGSGGAVSNKREVTFDIDADFPDFSSIGHGVLAYSPESVLVALQKLNGSYNPWTIVSIGEQLKLFYAVSFCCEMHQRWDKAFTYGIAALKCIQNGKGATDFNFGEKIIVLAESILSSIEDLHSDNGDVTNDMSALVSFVFELFQASCDFLVPLKDIEDCLIKKTSFLAPVLAVVLFSGQINVESLPFSVQLVLSSKTLPQAFELQLSPSFLNSLTASIIDEISLGSRSYNFLIQPFESSCVGDSLSTPNDELTSNSLPENFDSNLKQIIENRLKLQQRRNCIFLSSVTAATVSAASSGLRASSAWQRKSGTHAHGGIGYDSVVFTCNHNFPKYYIEDVILPEFVQRVQGLPKPLPGTANVLLRYYTQTHAAIPAACPCCVYNNLRLEQLHLLQETGSELSGNKSTFWEV